MSTDTALVEKRAELKHRLAAGEYKTLVDVLLAGTDRFLRKITGQTRVLSSWFIALILMLLLFLIIFLILALTGDWVTLHKLTDGIGLRFATGILLMLISTGITNVIGFVLINQYIGQIFILWREDVIDATESFVSLDQFEDWLEKISNRRLHLLVTIVLALLGSFYLVTRVSIFLGSFAGYGLTLVTILLITTGFSFLYLFFMAILLSARLRHYDLKLFTVDPASSELLTRLSGALSLFIYFVSLYAAYLTLGIASIGLFRSIAIVPAIVLLWIPIIAMFLLNQTSLSSMIRRSKWRTLNEIQGRVEKLQAASNFADKDTMDAINRLMDFHDRVKRTRNSAIDLGATLHFINSLLLPLLAFLLGNLDFVLNLFAKNRSGE